MTANIPQGYKKDSKNRLVKTDDISVVDLTRDELVLALIERANVITAELAAFKEYAFAEIGAFVEISAQEHGVQLGGDKGNVTLTSYDGCFKVQRALADNVYFDERFQAAKALIDECYQDWKDGAKKELIAIAAKYMQPNREGEISVQKIREMMGWYFDDERWFKAQGIMREALSVSGTTPYVRFYSREDTSKNWRRISLDIAGA